MRAWSALSLSGLLFIGACAADSPTAQDSPQFAVNGSGRLEVYNAGVPRAVPQTPCLNDERRRQFDFWLGEWNAGGTHSKIESILDGCVISEHYAGGSGRSINAFDPDDGLWHQTWVTVFHNGHLRLAGGLENGEMVLSGRRVQPNRVEWVDVFRWSRQSLDQVTQAFSLVVRRDATVFFQTSAAVVYTRPVTRPIPPPPVTTGCQAGGPAQAARQIDFWQGDWSVSREHGPALGRALVRSDLSGCLMEENYSTDLGYGATSFTYFDFVEQRWYRTYIDSEGERLELKGGFVNGALIMTGEEPGPDGARFQVRMTLAPAGATIVRQTWETRSDDAAPWRMDLVLDFTRS